MIIIDNTQFNIDISSLEVKADAVYTEQKVAGKDSKVVSEVRDNYKLRFVEDAPEQAYLDLWAKITEPVAKHTISIPDVLLTKQIIGYFAEREYTVQRVETPPTEEQLVKDPKAISAISYARRLSTTFISRVKQE